MRSLFYVIYVLKELASRHSEFQVSLHSAELVGREMIHHGLVPRKDIPTPSFHGDKSTEWLITEVDGTLHSIGLSIVQKHPDQFARFQTVIDNFAATRQIQK